MCVMPDHEHRASLNGGMGRGHLARLVGDPTTQVLAVCDVDRLRREKGQRLVQETYSKQRAGGT